MKKILLFIGLLLFFAGCEKEDKRVVVDVKIYNGNYGHVKIYQIDCETNEMSFYDEGYQMNDFKQYKLAEKGNGDSYKYEIYLNNVVKNLNCTDDNTLSVVFF